MGNQQSKSGESKKITYYDGSYYQGTVNAKGKQHGQGTIIYADKSELKGNFVDGQCLSAVIDYKDGAHYKGSLNKFLFEGEGEFKSPEVEERGLFRNNEFIYGTLIKINKNGEKSKYSGSLTNNKKEGYGKFTYFNGDHYVGYFFNDLYHGEGELKYASGSIYSGGFHKGKQHGSGIFKQIKQQKVLVTYNGEYKNGKFDGKGKIEYQNGDSYIGEFVNGKKHGFGFYNYKRSGESYEGEFVEDLKEGKGIFKFSSGSVYEGQFKKGKNHGNGYLKNFDQSQFYRGQYLDGKKHGKGHMKTSLIEYQGEFREDNMDGYGKVTYLDTGDVFIGEFKQNEKHGEGEHTQFATKNIFRGTYVEGRKQGISTYINTQDNSEETGTYQDNQKHGIFIYKKNLGNGEIKQLRAKFNMGEKLEQEEIFQNQKQQKQVPMMRSNVKPYDPNAKQETFSQKFKSKMQESKPNLNQINDRRSEGRSVKGSQKGYNPNNAKQTFEKDRDMVNSSLKQQPVMNNLSYGHTYAYETPENYETIKQKVTSSIKQQSVVQNGIQFQSNTGYHQTPANEIKQY